MPEHDRERLIEFPPLMTISAFAEIPTAPEDVFRVLGRLEHHWELTDGSIEVLVLDRGPNGGRAVGGRLRLRGPLGIRRTVRARILSVEAPHRLDGRAEVGRSTAVRIRWAVLRRGEGSIVALSAIVLRAGMLDRALLALGGRRWLRRRFRRALGRLACRFAPADGADVDSLVARHAVRAPRGARHRRPVGDGRAPPTRCVDPPTPPDCSQ